MNNAKLTLIDRVNNKIFQAIPKPRIRHEAIGIQQDAGWQAYDCFRAGGQGP